MNELAPQQLFWVAGESLVCQPPIATAHQWSSDIAFGSTLFPEDTFRIKVILNYEDP